MAVESVRPDYGIDRRTFIIAWESSDTADQVVDRLAAVSKELNLAPMPKPVILARASGYRSQGLNLKKYPPGRRPGSDVGTDNELVTRIRAEKTGVLSGLEGELVERVIAEVIRRLAGMRNV